MKLHKSKAKINNNNFFLILGAITFVYTIKKSKVNDSPVFLEEYIRNNDMS